jgi:hypothetical protein
MGLILTEDGISILCRAVLSTVSPEETTVPFKHLTWFVEIGVPLGLLNKQSPPWSSQTSELSLAAPKSNSAHYSMSQ